MKFSIVPLALLVFLSATLLAKPISPDVVNRVGGFFDRPDSLKGRIVIVNAQNVVSDKDIQPVVDIMRDIVCVRNVFVISGEPATMSIVSASMKKHHANVAVFLVNDKECANSVLVAPENHWAIINVASLMNGSKNVAFTIARTNKELLRTLLMLGGAYDSSYRGTIMGAVTDVRQLDDMATLSPPLDVVGRVRENLRKMGVESRRQVTYRQACQEGWAPAPTNDVQKAIWDKVHQLPTKPIKILPETKPVKE